MANRGGVYLGFIVIPAEVEHKITHRAGGGCTGDEVREAFLRRTDTELRRRPDAYPAQVTGFGNTHDGRRLFASFVALDESDGLWLLRTAYPV